MQKWAILRGSKGAPALGGVDFFLDKLGRNRGRAPKRGLERSSMSERSSDKRRGQRNVRGKKLSARNK